MSSVIISLALFFVPVLILLHVTRRARVAVSAICLGFALVLLTVPSGGHNPMPWLIGLSCMAIVAAAMICEVVGSVRAMVSKSAAHG